MPNEVAAPKKLDEVLHADKIIMDYKDHAYNPCNDLIFPTIVKTDKFPNPVDAYYMYYAPHDQPGGICMAHAPTLEGPWTEYRANPRIAREWPPHYKVGHISAPHVIWVEDEQKLFAYYHGDNDRTHYAVSKDGINFEYGGVALDQTCYADYQPGTYDRVFYGRVFEHRIPSVNSRYVFLFARSCGSPPTPETRAKNGIYVSWSNDARKWNTPRRIITADEGFNFVGSPQLFTLGGRYYVTYHMDHSPCTDVYVDEFDVEIRKRKPLGKLFDRRAFGENNLRVSDPLLVFDGNTALLFLAIDKKCNQRFALAKGRVDELQQALRSQA